MSLGKREEIDREIIVSFIKEEVYLDLIIDLDDDMLDSLKINKIGLRKKLLEAASRLKKKSPSSSDLNSNLIVESPLISVCFLFFFFYFLLFEFYLSFICIFIFLFFFILYSFLLFIVLNFQVNFLNRQNWEVH